MSQTTKKKHVVQEVLYQFQVPEENQQIVKVIASRGNNLHEVVTPDGDKFLVSMPSKFRKNIWIKRGDYVITEPIEEGNKVKAEIISILLKEQIKYIKEEGKWPSAFDDKESSSEDSDSEKLFKNTNRSNDIYESSSGSETDNEDLDDEEDEEEDDQSLGDKRNSE